MERRCAELRVKMSSKRTERTAKASATVRRSSELAGDDNGQAGVNGTATAGEGTSKRKRGMKSSTTKNTQTAGQQDNGQAGAVSKRRLVKPLTKVRENIEDANVVKAAKVKKMAKDHAKKNQKEKSVAAAAELAAMDPDSDPIDLSSS